MGCPLASLLGPLWRGRPQARLLTEEEYREQGERQTRASLEELRQYCSKPGFPAWDTVLRLRYPQRYGGVPKHDGLRLERPRDQGAPNESAFTT